MLICVINYGYISAVFPMWLLAHKSKGPNICLFRLSWAVEYVFPNSIIKQYFPYENVLKIRVILSMHI